MLKQKMKNEIFSSESPPSVSGIANLQEKKFNKGTKKLESRHSTVSCFAVIQL